MYSFENEKTHIVTQHELLPQIPGQYTLVIGDFYLEHLTFETDNNLTPPITVKLSKDSRFRGTDIADKFPLNNYSGLIRKNSLFFLPSMKYLQKNNKCLFFGFYKDGTFGIIRYYGAIEYFFKMAEQANKFQNIIELKYLFDHSFNADTNNFLLPGNLKKINTIEETNDQIIASLMDPNEKHKRKKKKKKHQSKLNIINETTETEEKQIREDETELQKINADKNNNGKYTEMVDDNHQDVGFLINNLQPLDCIKGDPMLCMQNIKNTSADKNDAESTRNAHEEDERDNSVISDKTFNTRYTIHSSYKGPNGELVKTIPGKNIVEAFKNVQNRKAYLTTTTIQKMLKPTRNNYPLKTDFFEQLQINYSIKNKGSFDQKQQLAPNFLLSAQDGTILKKMMPQTEFNELVENNNQQKKFSINPSSVQNPRRGRR